MKNCSLIVVVLAMLGCVQGSFGMATEQIGPDRDRRFPTGAQPDWPAGMVKLLQHDSRVYSIWVNGNENFYFKAKPDEINQLIDLFSKIRMRDHELRIKVDKEHVNSFSGQEISYNVNFHYLGGISLGATKRKGGADTYEPTLTVFAPLVHDPEFWEKIILPDNIILNNEVSGCPLKSKATKSERKLWCGQVQFDDATPAVDFEHGLSTKITLWQKGFNDGIPLGRIERDGYFDVVFSDREIADLKAGTAWLTLTAGNFLTEPRPEHPRVSFEKLSLDKKTVQPVKIGKPRPYYGRLLFENDSPVTSRPYTGREVMVDFPYAGSAHPDDDGYFMVYFTEDQFAKAKERKVRKNIYIPDYEERDRATARFAYPVSQLSQDKEKAGVVKIPKPGFKKDGAK